MAHEIIKALRKIRFLPRIQYKERSVDPAARKAAYFRLEARSHRLVFFRRLAFPYPIVQISRMENGFSACRNKERNARVCRGERFHAKRAKPLRFVRAQKDQRIIGFFGNAVARKPRRAPFALDIP